ncbi:tRNA (cytosine(38)-C(5))-methyltransferase [Chelonus insularis]|uniref:tRNA (cytosine(38)-C(5))-methyltransferase n=1 Tax=Chelonus insularis TaxID=460826 RepID=UPI00158C8C9F|nr:tRNA (cytosine(38)-C(5))-methyltransferase [Chelonus insularis]
MKILELYAGIGGMHWAFKRSGVPGKVVAAIEINPTANEVYKHNFSSTKVINKNIESLTVKQIEDMNIDAIFMSPPCQPFTKNGLQKDADDARTNSFFHVLELIPHLSNLKFILLENVEPFQSSFTRNSLISCLQNSGFCFKECILNPQDFNVPNSRTRYFLIAKKNNLASCFSHLEEQQLDSSMIINTLSECSLYQQYQTRYPEFFGHRCQPLSEIIENNINENEDYIDRKLSNTVVKKHLKVYDVRTPEDRGSCCFTSAYGRYAEGTGSIFSPLSKSEVTEKLNQFKLNVNNGNQIDEYANLPENLKLRYFTPKEVSRLMCFPENFEFPNSITQKQKYKLLGNSINVHVVSHLILMLHFVPDNN